MSSSIKNSQKSKFDINPYEYTISDSPIIDYTNSVSTSNCFVTNSYTTGSTSYFTNLSGANTTLNISSDDIIFSDGLSLKNILYDIQEIKEKLLILKPDPEKLEKYEALKKAYEQYKFLEKLLYEEPKKP